MESVGLDPKNNGGGDRVKRFLNRILGIKIDLQNKIFELFSYVVRITAQTERTLYEFISLQ